MNVTPASNRRECLNIPLILLVGAGFGLLSGIGILFDPHEPYADFHNILSFALLLWYCSHPSKQPQVQ
jgi:hypothetical protein